MNILSIKAYAQKHKLSLFMVMKKTKSGELESQEVEIDGKMRMMIVEHPQEEKRRNDLPPTLDAQVKELQQEVRYLHQEIALLKKKMQTCTLSKRD